MCDALLTVANETGSKQLPEDFRWDYKVILFCMKLVFAATFAVAICGLVSMGLFSGTKLPKFEHTNRGMYGLLIGNMAVHGANSAVYILIAVLGLVSTMRTRLRMICILAVIFLYMMEFLSQLANTAVLCYAYYTALNVNSVFGNVVYFGGTAFGTIVFIVVQFVFIVASCYYAFMIYVRNQAIKNLQQQQGKDVASHDAATITSTEDGEYVATKSNNNEVEQEVKENLLQ